MKKIYIFFFIILAFKLYSQQYDYNAYILYNWGENGWLFEKTNNQNKEYDFTVIKNVPAATITMLFKTRMPNDEMVELIPTYRIVSRGYYDDSELYTCYDKLNNAYLIFIFTNSDKRMKILEGCTKDFENCVVMKQFKFVE